MRNFNLEEAIKKKKIMPFIDGPKIAKKELISAKEELKDAKDFLEMEKFKAGTVSAYYAIFHASRALLYLKGYREKSHIQLAYAIKYFYIDKRIISKDYFDDFLRGMELREMADYKRKFTVQGAEKNIKGAENAISWVEKVMERLKKGAPSGK